MNLQRKQELFLDAIEHSFSMASVAYERVIYYCRKDEKENAPKHEHTMVLDAWSFIDVVRRLRTVLPKTPGLKHSESLNRFLADTGGVPDFRHHVQHLDEKASAVAQTGRPIWGSFSWVRLTPDGKGAEIMAYMPGRLAKTRGVPMVNPAGREFHAEIDHFEVTVGETTLNLSEIYRRIESLRERFGRALKTASKKAIGPDDTILMIDLDANPDAGMAAERVA